MDEEEPFEVNDIVQTGDAVVDIELEDGLAPEASTPNDENARIALIRFAERNKVEPWIEKELNKSDKKLEQGVTTN